MGLFSSNNSTCKSREKIEALYNKKIDIFLNGRAEDKLNEKEIEILNRLYKSQHFDPRHKDIYFEHEEEAKIGTKIADKLNSMTDEEFLTSSYPYEWFDELQQKTLYQVINKDVLKEMDKNAEE